MSDPNAFRSNAAYGQYAQPTDQPQQDQRPVDPRQEFLNYRFSAEELRVIAECEMESFYYRSLPFSIGLGSAAYLGVKNGILKGNVKFGPWPKVIALGFFGYIAGRVSYMKKCQEKLMALPNSRFAEMVRRRKGGKNWDLGSQDVALSLAPFQSTTDSYSDEYSQPNSLNLDTNRPNYSGLDDVYHPTMEGKNDLNEELAIPTRKNAVTYDELRKRNRDEYAKSHSNPPPYQAPSPYYNQGIAPVAPPPSAATVSPPAGSYNPTPDNDRRRNFRARSEDDFGAGHSAPKNRYGDTWSE